MLTTNRIPTSQSPSIKNLVALNVSEPHRYLGTIQCKSQTHSVWLERVKIDGQQTTPVIAPEQPTWIVIHGWNSSATTANIRYLAQAIARWSESQVLILDWSTAVNVPWHQLGTATKWVPLVAEWVAQQLLEKGFSTSHLNLIGHSFGSYVASEIAARLPGGVNQLIALDPAAKVPGLYCQPLDFRQHSRFAWAFYGSLAGSAKQVSMADAAFSLSTGKPELNFFKSHARVVKLFAALLHYQRENPNHSISQHFWFQKGDRTQRTPWQPGKLNELGGRTLPGIGAPFAGRLHLYQSANGRWLPRALQYRTANVTFFDSDTWLLAE